MAILSLVLIAVVAMIEGGVWSWRRSRGRLLRRISASLLLLAGVYGLLMLVGVLFMGLP